MRTGRKADLPRSLLLLGSFRRGGFVWLGCCRAIGVRVGSRRRGAVLIWTRLVDPTPRFLYVQFILDVGRSILELADAFPQSPGNLWNPLRAEHE